MDAAIWHPTVFTHNRDRLLEADVARAFVFKTGQVRKTAIDGRTTRHPGYAISLRCRKRIEEVFGWIKTQAGFAKVKVRSLSKVEAVFAFAAVAYNLVRLPKLLAGAAA